MLIKRIGIGTATSNSTLSLTSHKPALEWPRSRGQARHLDPCTCRPEFTTVWPSRQPQPTAAAYPRSRREYRLSCSCPPRRRAGRRCRPTPKAGWGDPRAYPRGQSHLLRGHVGGNQRRPNRTGSPGVHPESLAPQHLCKTAAVKYADAVSTARRAVRSPFSTWLNTRRVRSCSGRPRRYVRISCKRLTPRSPGELLGFSATRGSASLTFWWRGVYDLRALGVSCRTAMRSHA